MQRILFSGKNSHEKKHKLFSAKEKSKGASLFLGLAVLVIISAISFYLWQISNDDKYASASPEEEGFLNDSGCVTSIEEKTVLGNSLAGVIEPGSRVRIMRGYYQCHSAQREDVVLLQPNKEANPIIKIIKGLPGDSLALKGDGPAWNILVNGEALVNSQGIPYQINNQGFNMLSLYVNDYQGVIPKNAYLILGNLFTGTADSTRYGLISISDILGKVELIS